MNKSHIKERVVQIAKQQSFSQEKFFRLIGMTSANFRGKAKETPLNSNALAKIVTEFPQVDIYWLLLGEQADSFHDDWSQEFSCAEKDEMIKMLKSQIEDLKADKEDLREMLRLSRKK